MPDESSATLPWEALKHTEGDIPWPALEQFADAVAADPGLWWRLRAVYDEFMDAEEPPPSYECLYVPAIFALAAPRLDEATRREIADFLVEELVNAEADEDVLLSEAMEAACGSMGPAALPAVLTAIERDEKVGGSLWDLTVLGAKSDDAALRARVAGECVRVLQQAERGELTPFEVGSAAWTLACLGRRDARPLLQRLYDKSDNEEERLELLDALHLMDGELKPDPLDDPWEWPVRKWLAQAWGGLREEYAEPDEESEEEGPEDDEDEWIIRFLESPEGQKLPDDQYQDAGFIIQCLLSYSRDYLRVGPSEFSKAVLEEVLLELLPRKVTAERETFENVAAVTQAFLRWLRAEGVLPNGDRLAETVGHWAKHIVANAMDPRRWGMAKSFMMRARADGVDTDDQAAVKRYMLEYNRRVLGEQEEQRDEEEPAAEEEYSPEEVTPPIVVPPSVGRNDPCPCGSGKKYKKCCGRKAKPEE